MGRLPHQSGDDVKIFISYKREEQAIAESVRDWLRANGYTTWMDIDDIPKGVAWPSAIQQGLQQADIVLGLMSERSIKSENVMNEWDYTLIYGASTHTRLLLAKLDNCMVPLNYVRLNWVDWRNGADFSRLKTALDNPTPSPAASIPPAEKAYLEWLYHRINTVLAAKIIFSDPANPDPIALVTERTRGAVDALFEKMPELDPLFAAMGLDNPDDSADYSSFAHAFEALDQRVLLLGEPGAGKTITLLHMARDAVVRRTQDRHAPLPLYAIIPFWDAYQHADWLPWLQSQSLNKLPTLVDDYTQGRLLLVLDGLDELGNSRPIDPNDLKQGTFDPRLRFMEQLPANNAVVVSCRIKDYHDIGQAIKLRGAITLQKLSTAQIEGFLAKMPPLLEAIQSDDRLREMVENPLLLSLFAAGYRDSSEAELRALADLAHSPGDLRDKIFERYVQERYEHEARKYRLRGEQPPYSLAEVYERLGYVAVMNAASNSQLSKGDDDQQDNMLVGNYDGKLDASFLRFALHIAILTPIESSNKLRFSHLRLRDYLAWRWFVETTRFVPLQSHKDREKIADGLGYLKDERVIKPLLDALEDAPSRFQNAVIASLGNTSSVRALDPLLNVLNSDWDLDADSIDMIELVVSALSQIGDPSAIDSIIHAFADLLIISNDELESSPDFDRLTNSTSMYSRVFRFAELMKLSLYATSGIELPDYDFKLGPYTDVFVQRARSRDSSALENENIVRLVGNAIYPLIPFGPLMIYGFNHALNDLCKTESSQQRELIRHQDSEVRLATLLAMDCQYWQNAREICIAALADKLAEHRFLGLQHLVELGDPTTVTSIANLLNDVEVIDWLSIRVCDAAADALEAIGTPKALEAVRQWEQTDIGKQRRHT